MKPMKPDISLLFDGEKEGKLFKVWKAQEAFTVEKIEVKDDQEETQLEHYKKVMEGYYEAWRSHDDRRND